MISLNTDNTELLDELGNEWIKVGKMLHADICFKKINN